MRWTTAVFVGLAPVVVAAARGPDSRNSQSGSPPPHSTSHQGQICEPVTTCGSWTDCMPLEELLDPAHLAPPRYRAVSGAYHGRVFQRMEYCTHETGRTRTCAVYCTGHGGSRQCVNALVQEDEICTLRGPPTRAPHECAWQGADCVAVAGH